MKNFLQDGDVVDLAVPYVGGILAGQGMLVGSIFGVATVAGAQNAVIAVARKGVFSGIAKATGQAWTAGARLFWNDTNRNFTTTVTSAHPVGYAMVAAASGDTTGTVLLGTSAPAGA